MPTHTYHHSSPTQVWSRDHPHPKTTQNTSFFVHSHKPTFEAPTDRSPPDISPTILQTHVGYAYKNLGEVCPKWHSQVKWHSSCPEDMSDQKPGLWYSLVLINKNNNMNNIWDHRRSYWRFVNVFSEKVTFYLIASYVWRVILFVVFVTYRRIY